MKPSCSARRVPRQIGQDDDGPLISGTAAPEDPEHNIQRAVVKPRKSSNLRKSFASSVDNEDDAEASGVVTPKRSQLSRIAVQRNALKRSALLASSLPTRERSDGEDRPSYNASALRELKESTPSTPRDLAATIAGNSDLELVSSSGQALDAYSKFGLSLASYEQSSVIPSATEIAEKKARRARLAKERQAEEYISVDPDNPNLDDDGDNDNVTRDAENRLILKPKDKYGQSESRLVADDEDVMENFDEFTEDGKIMLGRRAEAEATKRRKREMATQIAQAEGGEGSDDESDVSEKERRAAYEQAQTRHGTYAANTTISSDQHEHLRPQIPTKITPLPTLDGVLERLRKQLSDMQTSRMQKLQEMQALQREKVRLGEEEVRIQRALREMAEKFQQLRAEKGIAPAEGATQGLDVSGRIGELEDGDDGGDGIGGHPGLGLGGSIGQGHDGREMSDLEVWQ